MAQQTCTPTRIYKPVDSRYLFLGCSITKIEASIGWNEQISEVDVELVQDPCSGEEKIYFDANLVQKTTTAADPGFRFPNMGSPVFLKLDDFEFAGLIQSYVQTNNSGANPTFSVKLIDPRPILEGTQLIIGDYAGGVFGSPNILNVYGYAESFGLICPERNVLGGIFGSPAGAFGGAQVNENGMRWNIIREAVSLLTSAIPVIANKFSAYGRLIYRGADNPGYGVMKSDFIDPIQYPNQTPYKAFYFVDLSEVPGAPSTYRLTGTNISLLEAISQVCEDAGCDYYVELVPVRLGNQIIKIIKIRIVVRALQPVLGSIDQFISEAGNVISKSVGRELRNEPTSKFIIGSQVDSIFQADEVLLGSVETIIKPYWGVDKNGNIIQTSYDADGKMYFSVDITSLNALLYNPLDVDSVTITEYELQAALSGQDAWLAIASSLPSDLGSQLELSGVLDAERILDVLNRVGFAHHLIGPGKKGGPAGEINFDDFELEAQKLKDIETIFNFVLNYARDYYGKKYLVRVPYTCCRIDDESRTTTCSESPADSGWSEYTTIIGLPNPSFIDIFKEDNGKILPFARFNNANENIEISNVPEDDYLLLNTSLYIKGTTLFPYFVYDNFTLRYNPHAVIELAVPIIERLDETDVHRTKKFADKFFEVVEDARLALGLAGNVEKPEMRDILKRSGNSLLNLGIYLNYKTPDAIAVPIHSDVVTYGPWVAIGPPGLSIVQRDDGFAPWEYGSVKQMNLAANNEARQGVTHMQVSEQGTVTVPGYPRLNLGDELRFGGISTNTITTRSLLGNKPTINQDQLINKGFWDASSGTVPNVNPKNGDYYKVSKSGTTDVQGTSSWSNNDVIVYVNGKWEKQSGLNSLYMTYNLGQWEGTFGPNITNITVSIGDQGVQTTYNMRTFTPKFGRFSKNNSDKLKEYSGLINSVRKEARLAALTELKIRTNRTRTEQRLMSNRAGNPFSGFAASPPGVIIGQTITNEDDIKSTAVHVIKHNELVGELENYADKALMSLDGLLRPVSKSGDGNLPRFATSAGACITNIPVRPEPPINGYSPSVLQSNLDPWQNGHDIDILGRGDTVPDHLSIQLDDSYTADYRGFALKGPLLIHQWGFDLQGKPIPNANDSESSAEVGNFRLNTLSDSFLSGYLRKPNTWPVAPLDLRFDRNRGVWTAAQPYRLVRCRITAEDGLSTLGSACTIIDGNSVEGSSGIALTKSITVYAISENQTAKKGETIVAEYDTVDCKYYCIEVPNKPPNSGPGSPPGGFAIFIGKAIENSRSGDGLKYDSVRVNQCESMDGQEVAPLTEHEVKLAKHHLGGNDESKFHKHDVRIGDILIYAPVGLSGEYAAISDYSREHSIFLAKTTSESLGPDFPDFKATVKLATGENTEVDLKNRLRQPIKNERCCYIYRHKDLQPDTIEDEYWLIQGQFAPVCAVSEVSISSDRSGGGTSGPTPGVPGSSTSCSFSNTLSFSVKDITLYEEAAHKVNKQEVGDGSRGGTYLTSCMDVAVCFYCCSVYRSGCIPGNVQTRTNSAFTDINVSNNCNSDGDGTWQHEVTEANCNIENVEFD